MARNKPNPDQLAAIAAMAPDAKTAKDLMISAAVHAAMEMIRPHLISDENGGVSFSIRGKVGFISQGAPDQVKHAAQLLDAVGVFESNVAAERIDEALTAMFYIGLYACEIGLSFGRGKSSYEAMASYDKTTQARRRAGAATRAVTVEQERDAVAMIREKMRAGLRKTPACTRVAAELKKKGIEVDGRTLARWLNNDDARQR